jgi:hypothetical protein
MMRSLVLFSATVLALTSAAGAATYGGQSKSLPASFTANLAAVCKSPTLVLSAAAKTACSTGAFPRVTASTAAFVNSGTGAELNTLMRQLQPLEASK